MNAKPEQLNRYLKKHGLGGVEDPSIVHQLGFLVRDHAHFRQVLMAVEPAQRTTCYETMRPHLRFTAKPLDVYVAEAADIGARKELDKSAIDILAEQAIKRNERELATKGALTVHCTRCTAEAVFPAKTLELATKAAADAGWAKAFDHKDKKVLVFCPKCAKSRIVLVQ